MYNKLIYDKWAVMIDGLLSRRDITRAVLKTTLRKNIYGILFT